MPTTPKLQLFSAFLQDEVQLVNDRLRLTLGTKVEHNDYTGLNAQPNIRLSWTPNRRHTVWGAASRAFRTPARTETQLFANVGLGDPTLQNERLHAYELGYRMQANRRLSFDVATFCNRYDELIALKQGSLTIPFGFDNALTGKTYGAEVSANWSINSLWQMSTGYSWLEMRLYSNEPNSVIDLEAAKGGNPKHQLHLRSSLKLRRNLDWDVNVFYVDSLSARQIPSYSRVDTRFAWRPLDALEMSFGVQNLLDPRHPEFAGFEQTVIPTEVRRNVYGKIIWRF